MRSFNRVIMTHLSITILTCKHITTDSLNPGFLPPANELCEGYVFTPVCQSFCSLGGVPGQVPPPDQVPPPTRYTPTPQDQVHPVGPGTLLGPGTPPGPGTYLSEVFPPLRSSTCWEIRATSGRYASYWNAFLFKYAFLYFTVICVCCFINL